MKKVKVDMTYDVNIGDAGRCTIQVRETTTTLEGPLAGEQTVRTGFKPWAAKNANAVVAALREGKLTAILGKRVPNQTLYTVTIIDPNAEEEVEEQEQEQAQAQSGDLAHKE